MSHMKNSFPPLIPDSPIDTADQDRLGMHPHVKYLASKLAEYSDPHCLVMSLSGTWGSGKTSFLNLLRTELETSARTPNQVPIIINFNPWNFSSVDQLILMFFSEIGAAIGRKEKGKRAKMVGKSLDVFGSLLALGQISPVGGQYASGLSKLIKAGSNWFKGKSHKTIEELKEDLDKSLSNLGRRIIVLIDDLDRLDQMSMRLMFRLIRLNADFNNVTYVLAFDQLIVSEVLSKEQDVLGQNYLEKIVQVTFTLPPPDPRKLQGILTEEIDALIAPVPPDEWDSDRWRNLFNGGIRHLVNTPRDVTRYTNGLRLNMPQLLHDVNALDFVALEAIRTFAPDMHDFIARNSDLLIRQGGGRWMAGHGSVEDAAGRLDQQFKSIESTLVDPLKNIVATLFPEASLSPGSSMSAQYGTWRRERRICTVDFFDRYFHLQVFEDQVPNAEFYSIIAAADDFDGLRQRFSKLIDEGRFKSFLQQLEDRSNNLAPESVLPILLGIFDVGDELPFDDGGLMIETTRHALINAAEATLRAVNDQDKRVETASEVIASTSGLSSIVDFLAVMEPTRRSSEVNPIFSPDDFDGLRQVILGRIRDSGASGALARQPALARNLYRWRDWASLDEPKAYVEELIATDPGLFDFLVGMVGKIHSFPPRRTEKVIRKSNVAEFTDLGHLEGRIARIRKNDWDSLTEEQREAIDAFVRPDEEI